MRAQCNLSFRGTADQRGCENNQYIGRLHNFDARHHLNDLQSNTAGLRQQLNLHAYQALTAIKALIAHSIRTGAPLDEFFGNWRLPDKT